MRPRRRARSIWSAGLLLARFAPRGLGGCAAALVGGLIYKSTKSNEEKAAFVTNLQKTNLEREKAHLKPLDWCPRPINSTRVGPPRTWNVGNASRPMKRATRRP